MNFHSVPELLEEIRAGRMVVLVDDEDRENEGDLVIAADYITPQLVNFMATAARGLVCLALPAKQIEQLGLPLMVKDDFNQSPNRTAFTVSIEASSGVTTGISAADRAHTIKVASSPAARPSDVIVPGHVFPIRAQDGGVLKRAGHTEASVDLVRMAGLNPAAAICEIMNADGTMARLPDLIGFAEKHEIKMGSIEELINYRIQNESFVQEVASSPVDSEFGSGFKVHVFHNQLDGRDHLALVKGNVADGKPVLVRVHSECLLGDVFSCSSIGSGEALKSAFQAIDRVGRGVVLYLRNEDMTGRLRERVQAMAKWTTGDISPAIGKAAFLSDERDYGVGAQILRALGLHKIILLTNSTAKRVGLKGYGLEIVDSLPLTEAPVPSDSRVSFEGLDL
jgi:3,4-dihydroxy 2-butanone 4-phosphate synthase / GTP cyclohydrolase II